MRCCYLLPEVQHHQLVEVGDVVQIVAVKNEVLYMRDVIGKEASQPGGYSGRQEGRSATSRLSLNLVMSSRARSLKRLITEWVRLRLLLFRPNSVMYVHVMSI